MRIIKKVHNYGRLHDRTSTTRNKAEIRKELEADTEKFCVFKSMRRWHPDRPETFRNNRGM
jgi:hypothetical protein